MGEVYSILDIGGDLSDTNAWESGCKNLGHSKGRVVNKILPSIESMAEFFSAEAGLIFFGGHSWVDSKKNWYLTNQKSCTDKRILINFYKDHVIIYKGKEKIIELFKNKETVYNGKSYRFNLHKGPKRLILWAGCSLGHSKASIDIIMELFNRPMIFGFTKTTDSGVVALSLTGKHPWKTGDGFDSKSFFGKYNKEMSDTQVVKLWVDVGWETWKKNIYKIGWIGDKKIVSEKIWERFCSISRSGQFYRMLEEGIYTNAYPAKEIMSSSWADECHL